MPIWWRADVHTRKVAAFSCMRPLYSHPHAHWISELWHAQCRAPESHKMKSLGCRRHLPSLYFTGRKETALRFGPVVARTSASDRRIYPATLLRKAVPMTRFFHLFIQSSREGHRMLCNLRMREVQIGNLLFDRWCCQVVHIRIMIYPASFTKAVIMQQHTKIGVRKVPGSRLMLTQQTKARSVEFHHTMKMLYPVRPHQPFHRRMSHSLSLRQLNLMIEGFNTLSSIRRF